MQFCNKFFLGLNGDGTRITGAPVPELGLNDILQLGCHSKNSGIHRPVFLRWLLNGQEAPFDMLRPLTSGLYEHELSLGLQLFMSPQFWQRWSAAKEVGGRRILTLRCEAVYSRTLLHSEKSVRLNLRPQQFHQQQPANYLQNVANSGEHEFNWSLINLMGLNLILQSIILSKHKHTSTHPRCQND